MIKQENDSFADWDMSPPSLNLICKLATTDRRENNIYIDEYRDTCLYGPNSFSTRATMLITYYFLMQLFPKGIKRSNFFNQWLYQLVNNFHVLFDGIEYYCYILKLP